MKAFPHIQIKPTEPPGTHKKIHHSGMDLRDYFAGLAMQAIISNDHAMRHVNRAYKTIPVVRAVSMLSYEYADQMMEARKA